MKLGIIARADKTGLGNQTRDLVHMLKPSKVLVIDSRPFNNNEQFFYDYRKYNSYLSKGFLNDQEATFFMRDLDAVLTCEIFYNNNFVNIANNIGVRTYNQCNYEFLDNLVKPSMPLPTKFLLPSKWKLEEMQGLFNNVEYLPPPTFDDKYQLNRDINLKRSGKKRFLHVVGRQAIHDRNGTLDLLKSLSYTKDDFELVLKTQSGFVVSDNIKNDSRVTCDYNSPENETELYNDFDALILPRRYAGLCLPMNEGLMSGLPVIMTDINPNNQILPKEWLVHSEPSEVFMARTEIDVYSADPVKLAEKISWLCNTDLTKEKTLAYQIAKENYSPEVLLPKYMEILQ